MFFISIIQSFFDVVKNFSNSGYDISELRTILTKRNEDLIANGYPGFDVEAELQDITIKG